MRGGRHRDRVDAVNDRLRGQMADRRPAFLPMEETIRLVPVPGEPGVLAPEGTPPLTADVLALDERLEATA